MFDLLRKTKKAIALDGIAQMLVEHDNLMSGLPAWIDRTEFVEVTLKHIRNIVQIGQTS